jgi:hypothetical protein
MINSGPATEKDGDGIVSIPQLQVCSTAAGYWPVHASEFRQGFLRCDRNVRGALSVHAHRQWMLSFLRRACPVVAPGHVLTLREPTAEHVGSRRLPARARLQERPALG